MERRRFKVTATALTTAVTLAVSLLIFALGADDRAAFLFGLVPARLLGVYHLAPAVPAWLTPLSATLVHGGFAHLFLNMVALVFFGLQVERVLGAFGFAVLYLVGAYVAGLTQFAVNPASINPMIGASGAISALVGAYGLMFGVPKKLTRSIGVNRLLHAVWLAVSWTLLQIAFGWLMGEQGMMLATPAHVGGFVAGLLLQRPLLLWRYRKA
ncbi:rhomboid family intramembrane serine protease [Sphingomonas ginkgonis]|uniref:Rhomboid family intramembrane serine protease n=1 Tax=Sphingomonas ginkgonis TaxID=2315330 RepID=A0A429VAJ4_9SPHN|nr:rhomboid family intramembrane serine protease [Sphingomonas ginkgonis]RST31013.1 rhomboid family intramembrane serine protease [Sphingomonas ginkgonis]